MTAPTLDAATAAPEVDLNDDALVAAALSARMERQQHLFPDEPAAEPAAPDPAPKDAPAPDPVAVAAPDGADSTTPAQEGAAPAAPDAPDPFAVLAKDAKPLGYRVNATDRVFDAILEVPGKGALIPADKLDEVRNMVARYESNAAAVKDLMPKVQQLDSLTYTHKDANGQVQETLRGADAFHRVMERNAQLNAASMLILKSLTENPRRFVNDDGTPNADAIEFLLEKASVASERARFSTITERQTQQQTLTRQSTETEVRTTAVPNYLAQHHADLHAEDRAFLERRANQYLFTVTPEQAPHYGVAAGTVMLNLDDLNADLTHVKTLRQKTVATESATSAAVKAAEKAAAENARRNPVPPKPKAPAAPPRDRETGQWTRPKRLDPSEIFDRARSGVSIGDSHISE